MLAAFQEHLKNSFPALKEQHLLVAISGGLDSVVLTHLLHDLGYKIALAHCNFNLRAVESEGDQHFVAHLAKRLELKLHTKQFNTEAVAQQKSVSIQMAARELRYDFFEQLRKAHSYDYVLTAHHLDDQIETFLIHLNRGAGLNGLQGIPQINGSVIRPLLPFSREQIKDFATDSKIIWREDSSNSSNKYQRNQLRNEILPQLHHALPQLKAHFTQTLDYLKGSQDMVRDAVSRFRESGIKTTSTGINIDISQLMRTSNPVAYLYELVKEYGFQSMDDVMGLVTGISGKRIESDTHVIAKDREYITVVQRLEVSPVHLNFTNYTDSHKVYDGILTSEILELDNALVLVKKNKDKNILYLDTAQIALPLTLRSWKHGDRIKPFGMKGSKLVSDLLTDCKVSFITKEKTVVLTLNEEILWVVGIRSSKFHTVTASTTQLLKLTFII